MEVKDILRNLREKNHLTQEQMAERIGVTRQAVSRWETGMTQPNPELLKVLSREFGVSINTLLGSPRTLYCQCYSEYQSIRFWARPGRFTVSAAECHCRMMR